MNPITIEAILYTSILMLSFGIMIYLITKNKILIVKLGDKTEVMLEDDF